MGTIGRTNTGGAGLNLTILASVEQPGNPVENLIWFNTDTAIPHWYFQNTAPNDPETGDVYVTISTTATNVLQILRNNGMELYFGTPRQWNGSAWNIIGGKIYYNGSWHNLQTFVYDGTIGNAENNFNHSVGGYPWSSNGDRAGSLSAGADSFTCSWGGNGGGQGTFYTRNKIDFSAVNSVKITYTGSYSGRSPTHRASVFTSVSGGNVSGQVASAEFSNPSGKTTITINTSGVTGSYYLGFYVQSDVASGNNWSRSIKVYSIELVG